MYRQLTLKTRSRLLVGGFVFIVLCALNSSHYTSLQAATPTNIPTTFKTIDVNNVSTLSKLVTLDRKGTYPTWSPDGKRLAVVGERAVFVFDTSDFSREPIILHDTAMIDTAVFNLDGKLLASGNSSAIDGKASQITIWDLSTGKYRAKLKQAYAPVFDPEGKYLLASAAIGSGVIVWDLGANSFQPVLEKFSTPTFSPDGRLVAVAGFSPKLNIITVWKLSTLSRVATLEGTEDRSFVDDISFSLDGQLLAAGEDNGTLRLWDLKTLQPLRTLPTTCAQNVDFGNETNTLLVWSQVCDEGENTQLWQVSPPKKRWGLVAKAISSPVTFSPNGSLIMIADYNDIHFFDTATRREIFVLKNASQPEFSRDGSRLVTGSRDGTIQVWAIQ